MSGCKVTHLGPLSQRRWEEFKVLGGPKLNISRKVTYVKFAFQGGQPSLAQVRDSADSTAPDRPGPQTFDV
jgi:hypothetical protein